MSKHLKIKEMPLTHISDDLVIPTGAYGDVSVSISSIMDYFRLNDEWYTTEDPNLSINDSMYQKLILNSDGELKAEINEGQYMLVYVPSALYNLSYRSFDVCNQFDIDQNADAYILILGMGTRKLLFGCNANRLLSGV